jgi:hypothetical protein
MVSASSIPELKLLAAIPACLLTLAWCAGAMVYARNAGWSSDRTRRFVWWSAMTVLYASILASLGLIWYFDI